MILPRVHTLALAAATFLAASAAAHAAYPVSGVWTYDGASQPGAAKHCGQRMMKFAGSMRYDTETAAPDYRNISVERAGAATWRIVDQFYTAVVWGRVGYTLRLLDDDHIVIRLDKGGATWMLRRCG